MNKKICVVGGGRWGKNHIRTLSSLNALSGLVEKDETVLEKYKKEYPNIVFFTSVEDTFKYNFDGYIVATPSETHYKIASKIIENKHHVLIEKPITTKLSDAIKLSELAKKNKVNLMVGHVLLFHPAFKKIKELISEDTLGQIQYMYSNRLNLGTIRKNENVFWSFAPHDIALFQYFTNMKPSRIISTGSDILQKNIHDTTITSIKYPNNISGHIFVSWLHPFKEHRFVIVGSKGMVRFEDSLDNKPLIFYDKTVKWNNGMPEPINGSSKLIKYDFTMPLELELKYFIKHLDGTPIDIANSKNAIDVMKILEESTNQLMRKE